MSSDLVRDGDGLQLRGGGHHLYGLRGMCSGGCCGLLESCLMLLSQLEVVLHLLKHILQLNDADTTQQTLLKSFLCSAISEQR